MENQQLIKQIIEAALMVAGQPLNLGQLAALFPAEEQPEKSDLRAALESLAEDCESRGIEVSEVASGFRFQVKQDIYPHIALMWEEKPQRYSRALLETLALIAYRQPITRGEIEEVRGVSVSTNIIRTLEERDWIRVVGHRDVPGKPALYGTTREFLDYFNLRSLDQLPSLAELKDIDELEPELDFGDKAAADSDKKGEQAEGDAAQTEAAADQEPTDEQGASAETAEDNTEPHDESGTDDQAASADDDIEESDVAAASTEGESTATEASQGQLLTDETDDDTQVLEADEELDGDDEHLAADLDAMLAQVDNVLHGNKPGTTSAEDQIPATTAADDSTTVYSELAEEEHHGETTSQESTDQDDAATDDASMDEAATDQPLTDEPLTESTAAATDNSDSDRDDQPDYDAAVDHVSEDDLPEDDLLADEIANDDSEGDSDTDTINGAPLSDDMAGDDIEADNGDNETDGDEDSDHHTGDDPESDTPRHG